MLAAGCSCVPDSGAPWLVAAVLLLGSVAVLAAASRWRRRSTGARRGWAGVGARAAVAAALLAGLALLVAVVAPDADGSLLVLGAGVVVAGAGVAPTARRRRDSHVA
jgi:hypothetical protein